MILVQNRYYLCLLLKLWMSSDINRLPQKAKIEHFGENPHRKWQTQRTLDKVEEIHIKQKLYQLFEIFFLTTPGDYRFGRYQTGGTG